MKIKKNWSQFKEPQAPSTQRVSDRSLSGALPDHDTNNHNNIEVLPWLNDEELSDDESDNESDEAWPIFLVVKKLATHSVTSCPPLR